MFAATFTSRHSFCCFSITLSLSLSFYSGAWMAHLIIRSAPGFLSALHLLYYSIIKLLNKQQTLQQQRHPVCLPACLSVSTALPLIGENNFQSHAVAVDSCLSLRMYCCARRCRVTRFNHCSDGKGDNIYRHFHR